VMLTTFTGRDHRARSRRIACSRWQGISRRPRVDLDAGKGREALQGGPRWRSPIVAGCAPPRARCRSAVQGCGGSDGGCR
jgi:hypothetical protein